MSASNSKTEQVQGEVDEVVGIMHENINKVMQRGEQLGIHSSLIPLNLQTRYKIKLKAYRIHPLSLNEVHPESANKCGGMRLQHRFIPFRKNMKLNMIIGAVVLTIVIIIVVSVTSGGGKSEEKRA
jgi:hypothetical protein